MKKLIFLLFTIFTMVQVGYAQNLFVNSGFETATTGMPIGTPIPAYPTLLDGWGAVTVDGEFIRDPLYAHTGNGYLSVLQNAGENAITPWLGVNGGGGYDRVAQAVPVSGNTQYQLGVWYRAGNGDRYGYGAGDFVLQVEQQAPTNAVITTRVLPATLTWQYTTLTFTTGASASSIIVLFSCSGVNNVDVWVDDVELRLPCSLSVDLGNDTTLCAGDNLLLDATTASATGYMWQGGSTNPTFNVTTPGIYWVQVDSAGICTASDTIVVSYATPLAVDLGDDTTLCIENTLSLDATTASATSYQWQDGSTNATYLVDTGGVYWVQVNNGNCFTRDTIVVTDSVCTDPCPTLTFTYTLSVTTAGLNTGAARVTVTGGQAPYNYSLDNVVFQPGNTFTYLPIGTYQLFVTDSNGCSGQDTFIIDAAGCCGGQ